MAADPYKYFRIEAAELVEGLGKGILDLEKTGSAETVGRLLRLAHTLKGAARVVRQPQIADHAHAIEDQLAPYRERGQPVPADVIARLLALVDAIGDGVTALTEPASAAAPASAPVEELARGVRADSHDLDTLLDAAVEANARLGALAATSRDLEVARRLAESLLDRLQSDERRDLAEQLRDQLAGTERRLRTDLEHATRELDEVRAAAEQLRLVPAASLFTSLERTARDVAQSLG
ncbi:MAG: hypothetical protein HOV81_28975 [Kofleriaceae bacterium]|nr:hypothetical protein [Kofleriaceae bacterium]